MKETAALLLAFVLLGGCSSGKRLAYEDRERWQQPERMIAALDLRPGDRVADLGSGSGYFTFHLARAVGPAGRVYVGEEFGDAYRGCKADVPRWR